MRFTVIWTRPAEDSLANFWIEANPALRESITKAAAEIDRLLASSADSAGESRETESRRMLVVLPLAVTFKVYATDRAARIASVHLVPERR
jgi:hypothetical protein